MGADMTIGICARHVECQWCKSDNTYAAGYSPMCTETQYKCRECNRETWFDDREVAQ